LLWAAARWAIIANLITRLCRSEFESGRRIGRTQGHFDALSDQIHFSYGGNRQPRVYDPG